MNAADNLSVSAPLFRPVTRRRAIALAAVAAGAAGVPLLFRLGAQGDLREIVWHGTTLGASSTIKLYHKDEAFAQRAIDAALAELERMEAIFSVYRADSVISRLNSTGHIENAPAAFTELLTKALTVSKLTDGIFDPTIQPLWSVYFNHFMQENANPAGPSQQAIQQAMTHIGWQHIDIDVNKGRVAFNRPNMAITLNSIGQGYITDRVSHILRQHGFDSMLVDMGEPRALNSRPDGKPWHVGIANPADPSQAITEVNVRDKCVATSGGYGTLFDDAGKFTHIINPKTGLTVPAMFGVSVIAPTATIGDSLSTAMLLVPPAKRRDLLVAGGGNKAIFVTPNGVSQIVEA
ncbi:FAD:protein FMN transferase [Zymomonas mobilis]|uniref:FAD:protein FMN transferase n=1 Tax=Zymomonas mobilis subsp. pomaceae (strain ATCC 29192 / DSM 22645 / JCM 10191 / CCUG 17912 / NBRC 13757 / NCIMB 11200 / NRRL B-4491 / Barker I) TaxID=579138 RepID=F8EUM5_ZYMMT|nr:FAD:protein FMN transferase [Zymomonas mobilis]AEI38171.1 ApbE family lipoprotein [Zymomonas mobilis subsp. pomaceae ATCC 29192]MDX5947861.1 FAD:protein FMN transferase [Zymomonas mobilis subsp. pomaceae]GEB90090.1 FAD:protein FMN transferase [Zymomonas mobilis subsp. pomaceae]